MVSSAKNDRKRSEKHAMSIPSALAVSGLGVVAALGQRTEWCWRRRETSGPRVRGICEMFPSVLVACREKPHGRPRQPGGAPSLRRIEEVMRC